MESEIKRIDDLFNKFVDEKYIKINDDLYQNLTLDEKIDFKKLKEKFYIFRKTNYRTLIKIYKVYPSNIKKHLNIK